MSYDLHVESTASDALPLESVTVKMTLRRGGTFHTAVLYTVRFAKRQTGRAEVSV